MNAKEKEILNLEGQKEKRDKLVLKILLKLLPAGENINSEGYIKKAYEIADELIKQSKK